MLGIFWRRANRWGALCGMAGGLALTLYYMIRNEAWLRGLFGVAAPIDLWFGIQPMSAGVFGVPLGFVACVVVSLLTRAVRQRLRTNSSAACASLTRPEQRFAERGKRAIIAGSPCHTRV